MLKISGIWTHLQSTATSLIGMAVAVGYLTAPQGSALETVETAVVALVAAIGTVVNLFYAGQEPAGPSV